MMDDSLIEFNVHDRLTETCLGIGMGRKLPISKFINHEQF